MVGKTPRWESELWSYLSSGDGNHCPLISQCKVKQKCSWCPDANREHIVRLLNGGRFDINTPDFIKIKSEGERPSRIFQLVEMLVQRYLKKRGIRCPPVPTELFSLADEQHPIEARLLPLKVYHGAIWRLRERWVIQLKDDDISATKRFTLFHEAFHILAHCKASPVFRSRRALLRGSFNELLADYFAVCILMPRQWVEEKWAEVHDLNRMAEIFGVPEMAMALRLRQLDFI